MGKSVFKNVYLGNNTNGKDISDRISYLQFAQSIKHDDSVNLYAEGESADYLLELDELTSGRPIVFNFGFLDGAASPTYRAIITDLEPTYSTEGTKLKISCGDRGRTMRKVSSKKVWKKKSTDQIIQAIANMHGLNTYIEVPVGGFLQHASLPQGSLTNMDFCSWLASIEKDGNYICFVSGDDLHFVTRNITDESSDKITVKEYPNLVEFAIKYRETTAPLGATEVGSGLDKINNKTAKNNTILGDSGIYTMSGAVYFKRSNGERSLLIDEEGRATPAAKKVFVGKEGFDKFYTDAVGKAKSTAPQKINKVGSVTYVPVKAPEVRSALEAELLTNGQEHISAGAEDAEHTTNQANSIHKSASHKVLTASLKEYGNPYRKINAVITVDGIATRYIGNWLVEVVSHNVGANDYYTTSECSKNGLKKGGNKVAGNGANKNTKPASGESTEMIVIPLNTQNNGKTYLKDKHTGTKREVRYKPYEAGKDPGFGNEQ